MGFVKDVLLFFNWASESIHWRLGEILNIIYFIYGIISFGLSLCYICNILLPSNIAEIDTSPFSVVMVPSYHFLYNITFYFILSNGPLLYVDREEKNLGFGFMFLYYFNSWYFRIDWNQIHYNLGRRSNKILHFFFYCLVVIPSIVDAPFRRIKMSLTVIQIKFHNWSLIIIIMTYDNCHQD